MSGRIRGQSGASAVEFALLLPLLIMILFGTMYGASLFNTQQTITQSAREGARLGATLPVKELANTGAWLGEVEARTLALATIDRPLTPGDWTVCVRFYDVSGAVEFESTGGGCPAPIPTGSGLRGPTVEVTTSRPARLELGVVATPQLTLSHTSSARYEPEDME